MTSFPPGLYNDPIFEGYIWDHIMR